MRMREASRALSLKLTRISTRGERSTARTGDDDDDDELFALKPLTNVRLLRGLLSRHSVKKAGKKRCDDDNVWRDEC